MNAVEPLGREAEESGRNAGWIHAAMVQAYGYSDDTQMPNWFGSVPTYWQAGYDEGKELFENGMYVDGTPMGDDEDAA